MVRITTDGTFDRDVLGSKGPVMVDFWASWCGPCMVLGPIMEKISDKMSGKVDVYKLNVDDNPQTATKFGITGIPTVIIFKNGQIERQFVGVQPEQVYINSLE